MAGSIVSRQRSNLMACPFDKMASPACLSGPGAKESTPHPQQISTPARSAAAASESASASPPPAIVPPDWWKP